MPDDQHLTPATPDELAQALAHALRFDGKRQFKPSGEMMAKITATHLVEQLRAGGFVVMKTPAAKAHSYSPGLDRAPKPSDR